MTNQAIHIPRHIYRGKQSQARRFTSNITQSGRITLLQGSRVRRGAPARVNFELSYVHRGVSRAHHRCIPLHSIYRWCRVKNLRRCEYSARSRQSHFSFAAPVKIYGALSATNIRCVWLCVWKNIIPASTLDGGKGEPCAVTRCASFHGLSTIGWPLRKIAAVAAVLRSSAFVLLPNPCLNASRRYVEIRRWTPWTRRECRNYLRSKVSPWLTEWQTTNNLDFSVRNGALNISLLPYLVTFNLR